MDGPLTRIFAIALLLPPLAACGGGDPVLGSWQVPNGGATIEFRSNGTFTMRGPSMPGGGFDGTWERVDDTHIRTTIRIETGAAPIENTETVEVTLSGDQVTIRGNGSPETFIRQ